MVTKTNKINKTTKTRPNKNKQNKSWCVPANLMGLIMSPFMVPAPHCFGLRWLIYQGGNSIMVMWSIVGGWLLSFILPIKND